METNKNPMPQFELFRTVETLKNIGKFVINRFYPSSDDEVLYRGGAAMLDRELYEQPELPWPLESDGIEV